MKYGIIYGDWAIILELNTNDNISNILRKSGTYYFIRDWRKYIDGKKISQYFFIADKAMFTKHLHNFKNEQDDLEKALWDLEMQKISTYDLNQLQFLPKISVILACYNSIKSIQNSIRSIIKQTYKNIELIVIDDFSDDGSFDKIVSLKEKYGNKIGSFEIIRNEKNMGAYYSRNIGISKSTGSLIAIQDADDLSDHSRLSVSAYELINNNVDFVLSNGQKIKQVNDLSPISVTMATLVARKDFFDKYGMYDSETRHSGDLEIIDRAHFIKYGTYEMDNFWYWLNYTDYKEGFYKHIYENLYFIGEENEGITKNNNLKKRLQYLNDRRKIMKNKMLQKQ